MRPSYLFLLLLLSGILLRPSQTLGQGCLDAFTTVGTAVADGNCYRMTQQNVGNSRSAIWNNSTINLNYDFDFTFTIDQCGGADGVVFVLQNSGPRALHSSNGGTIGYYQDPSVFRQSLGVEMDIYYNVGTPYNDPSSSHMMVALNGQPTAVAGPVNVPELGSCASSLHTLHIAWDHTAQRLLVELDGVPRLTFNRDLVVSVFGGNPNVWFGFTAATGGQTANQTICPVALRAGLATAIVAAGPTTLCPAGSVALSVRSQPAGTTYQWSPAAGLNTTTGATVVASPTVATTYQVRVTTPGGCQGSDSIRVTVAPSPVLTVNGRQVICPGDSAVLSASSSGANATYRWSPAAGLNKVTGAAVTATPAVTTLYTVTAMGSNVCPRQDTVRVIVRPRPVVTVPAPAELAYGDSTTLTATTNSPGTTFQWSPATGLNTTSGATVTAKPEISTTYTVTGTDANGCLGQTTVDVAVTPRAVFLPNIITPNGDRYNETFQPYVSREAVKLQVFNRWGRLVFEQDNYANTWAAEGQTDGLYYYRLSTATGQSWKGWLEVVR